MGPSGLCRHRHGHLSSPLYDPCLFFVTGGRGEAKGDGGVPTGRGGGLARDARGEGGKARDGLDKKLIAVVG